MGFIPQLKEDKILSEAQASLLYDIESGRLFSLSTEIRALLYSGALFLIAGVSATVKQYFLHLGPLAIVSALSAAIIACLAYCFSKSGPYAPAKADSPTAAFDYLLYLACAFIGIEFGYIETHFHLLDKWWDTYLLVSAILFFCLAYRFDNRLVLSMALINLGAWAGLRLSAWGFVYFSMRDRAIAYGLLMIGTGKMLESAGVKKHFLDVYLNLGINLLLCALISGLDRGDLLSPCFISLMIICAGAIAYALNRKRFQYFLYGVFYGYCGFTYCISHYLHGAASEALYLLISASLLVWMLLHFRKTLAEQP